MDLLSPFDDYPLHQTSQPIAVPNSSDRNVYGRYWFGAGHQSGDFHIEMSFGRYPNLGVVDGHVSVVVGGRQASFHSSARAPIDPTDTSTGAMTLEIVRPLNRIRMHVAPNDTGIACDLTFDARTGALLEDHTAMSDGVTTSMDMSRFVQFGAWSGTIQVDDTVIDVRPDEVFGIRDRSWGVRPVGTRPVGRPSSRSPMAWLWAPLHFPDHCRVAGWFELPGGMKWRADGHVIPVGDPVPPSVAMGDPGVARVEPKGARLEFESGTRWAKSVGLDLISASGDPVEIELRPLLRFDMKGIGYSHPTWGHGVWQGESVTEREDWVMADVSPTDPTHQHVHHLVTATMGDRTGYGIFEQIIHGPHTQWGFQEALDVAP